MGRKKVLFVLHLPPPVHGASVMGAVIRDSTLLNARFDCRFLNLSSSSSLEEIGRWSVKKLSFLFRMSRSVRKEIRQWHPDLVYFTPTASFPGVLKDYGVIRMSGCKRHVRTVLHFHNKGIVVSRGGKLRDWIYRDLFRSTKVILLSERLYPDVANYVSRENVSICPNGLDYPTVAHSKGNAVPEVLFLSNLIPSKGVGDLLDACCLLRDRGVPFSCRFVGGETTEMTRKGLWESIENRGLQSMVRYDGPLFGAEKQSAFAHADVFVLPTREDCFPLVILEAMAAGLPVVSTYEGGIPDEVQEGETGLLYGCGDVPALADALQKLLTDKDLRLRMGKMGRLCYLQRFTAACFEKRFEEILLRYA
jgi:glycosyltransferase involved in cell wall biosynthesis